MKRLLGLVFVLLCAFAIAACDSGDDGDDNTNAGEAFTATTACEAVFECRDDNFGFSSIEDCEGLYVTDCKDAAGFLACGGNCYANEGCNAFSGCEPGCWDTHCK